MTARISYLEHMEQQATLGVNVTTQMGLMVGCHKTRELGILSGSYVGIE